MQAEITSDYIDQLKVAIATRNNSFLKDELQKLYAADIAIVFNEM